MTELLRSIPPFDFKGHKLAAEVEPTVIVSGENYASPGAPASDAVWWVATMDGEFLARFKAKPGEASEDVEQTLRTEAKAAIQVRGG